MQRFDVPFHQRRAVFLLNKINQLCPRDDDASKELENLAGRAPQGSSPAITALIAQVRGDADAREAALAACSALTDDM